MTVSLALAVMEYENIEYEAHFKIIKEMRKNSTSKEGKRLDDRDVGIREEQTEIKEGRS